MNMSIGARAALNDHLRYVAKYGIDGEKENNTSMASGSLHDSEEDEEEERILLAGKTTNSNNILDEHWETLLNSSLQVNSSSETGSSSGIPAPPGMSSCSIRNRYHDVLNSSCSPEYHGTTTVAATDDSIEVMTDVSHDFFNSSRVNVLRTPERNRNRRLDMVVTRDRTPICNPFCEDSFLDTSEEYHDTSGITDDRNTSLQSFNPGDISRISAVGSDTRRSPEESFLSQDHHLEIDDSALSPILDTSARYSPFRPHMPSSFLPESNQESDFVPFDNSGKMFAKPYPMSSPSPISKSTTSPERRSSFDLMIKEKHQSLENSSGSSKINSSSIQSTMSSIIEEAKSMVQHVANELEQSFGALESLQADFLRTMDIGSGGSRSDAPSPISQVESNSSSNGSTKRKCTIEGDTDAQRRFLVTKNPARRSLHPSSSSAVYLTGRKRFRTVVPRRVLLGSSYHTDDEQDSFMAVRSNPETTRRSEGDRSIFESFDDSVLRTTI
jgi:hypothetical protein